MQQPWYGIREKRKGMCKSQGGSHGTVPRTLTKRSARSRAQRRGRWVPPPHSRSAVRVRGGAVKVRRGEPHSQDARGPGAGTVSSRGSERRREDEGSRTGTRPAGTASEGGGAAPARLGEAGGPRRTTGTSAAQRRGAPGCGARGSGRPGSRLADPWLSGRRDAFPSTGPRAAAPRFPKEIDTVPPDSRGECSGFGSG